MWLKRSIALRTEAYLDGEITKRVSSSLFLTNTEQSKDIASFQRNEIEIGNLLGEGSFAEVFEVKSFHLSTPSKNCNDDDSEIREYYQQHEVDDKGGSQYAIKSLKSRLIDNQRKFHQAATSLVLEARFLAHCDHPNIVKLRGLSALDNGSCFVDGSGGFFLILDTLDETLEERINRWEAEKISASMDEESKSVSSYELDFYTDKIRYGIQIARALEYLHAHGIIYRDLKPANIGFKGETVQLFDFGIVRELPEGWEHEDELFHMSQVGTRRYMAPEVFLGKPYNLKADVFSFAILLQQMLSLEKPFSMYNAALYKLLVCEEGIRPSIYPEWPSEVQDLLHDGWAPRPIYRPNMKQVRMTLENALCQCQGSGLSHPNHVYELLRETGPSSSRSPSTKLSLTVSFRDRIHDDKD